MQMTRLTSGTIHRHRRARKAHERDTPRESFCPYQVVRKGSHAACRS
ncbi:hypothetical protein X946_5524 [Burkholderia sp. ABCPW 111]|nr:hypothetical protein X946_5524 [Burkholderia sp. ABCPW 111]